MSDMKKYTIKATKSTDTSKFTLEEGMLPGVIYGPNSENIKLKVDYRVFLKAYRVVGKSTLIDLDLDGTVIPVLVHEVQVHPVREDLLHIDFYAVDQKKPVSVVVQLIFEGDPQGVRTYGGILVTEKNDLNVKCLPKDLVTSITIDTSGLDNIGKAIYVRDVNLPEGMENVDSDDVLIAHIVPPKLALTAEEEGEAAEGEEGEATEGEEGEATEGELSDDSENKGDK